MDYRKEFIIPFVGLNAGNHRFELEVKDEFFGYFEYSELHHGLVNLVVDLDKQERMMVFFFHFEGNVEVTCDRCGEEYMMPLDGEEQLIVKFGQEFQEESDEMIVIPSTEYKIDLAPFIYEYLHLLLPVRNVHPDNENGDTGCNPEVLRRLEQLAPRPAIDPRWEALSSLPLNGEDVDGPGVKAKDKKKK